MTRIRPTRRGGALALVSFGLLVVGILANTVQVFVLLVPFAIVGAIGYWQVFRQPLPQIERYGAVSRRVGTSVTIELDVDGSPRLLGTVVDALPLTGVDTDSPHPRRLAGPGTHAIDVSYKRRGQYEFGPTTVTLTDSLGLFQRSTTLQTVASVYVYPPLVGLPGGLKRALETAHGDDDTLGRTEFDRLREYDRSAALRDIDWKTSAKQPDETFIVKEFIGPQRRGTDGITIGISAGSTAGADGVAAVAASIAAYLLEQDVAVGLQTPAESVEPDTGAEHHRRLDERLAVFEPGGDGADDAVDVAISAANEESVTVTVFDETHTLTTPTAGVSQP